MENKVYIFISHSHQDIAKVRIIRNYLESLAAEPILFFLLSKTDEDEITQLIKDEIGARIWFIYCKSENSEKSKWCQTELQYAKEFPKSNLLTIDLDTSFDEEGNLKEESKNQMKDMINRISRVNTCFFSFPYNEIDILYPIMKSIANYGFDVSCTLDLKSGCNFLEGTKSMIDKANYFIVFIYKELARSTLSEMKLALDLGKRVLPILVYYKDSSEIFDQVKNVPYLRDMVCLEYDLSDIEKSNDHLFKNLYHLC